MTNLLWNIEPVLKIPAFATIWRRIVSTSSEVGTNVSLPHQDGPTPRPRHRPSSSLPPRYSHRPLACRLAAPDILCWSLPWRHPGLLYLRRDRSSRYRSPRSQVWWRWSDLFHWPSPWLMRHPWKVQLLRKASRYGVGRRAVCTVSSPQSTHGFYLCRSSHTVRRPAIVCSVGR